MATIKISELEEVTKLSTGDFLPIVNDNETKKVSLEQLDEMLMGEGIPEYVAEFGFNYNSSSVWWSTSGDAGSAIQAALQKALDNGEKYFKLIFRNTASGPPVLETYMYYNSSSNTLSQRQQYSVYTSSYTNEKMIYSRYVGSITDGVVGNGSTGYIWSLMTDYVPYTTTAYVDDSVSKKQDILTAGDNITIVDNVISATGGGASVDLSNYYTKEETNNAISTKQPLLTAGDNITIDENNVISATIKSSNESEHPEPFVYSIITTLNKSVIGASWTNNLLYLNSYKDQISAFINAARKYVVDGGNQMNIELAIIFGNREYTNTSTNPSIVRFYPSTVRVTWFEDTSATEFVLDSEIVGDYENSNNFTNRRRRQCYVQIQGSWVDDVFTCSDARIYQRWSINEALPTNNTISYTPTGDYNPATKKYVDDSIAAIDISGGSGESSVPMFSWDFNSTDATVVAMFQEWWNLFKTSGVMYPISKVSNSGSIYEGNYWFPYMEARLSSNTSITITFINIKGNNTVYMPKPTIQYKLVTIMFGDKLSNNGTVSSITVDSAWSHSPLVSYNPSGSYAQQQMDSSALLLSNTYEYTPTGDYNPATKKYVDDVITSAITTVLEAEY